MIYTVFGLLDSTSVPPRLQVAAVVEGVITPVDEQDYSSDHTRWADQVDAPDPQTAEDMARTRAAYTADNVTEEI